MGTGFTLDPNEYRAAADVIEGYGATQADHGSALASGTSNPLSSSGTGIGGAISMIAQGTVQKIVTDVTSTTKGFADDTAQGLRTQAAGAEQLETEIAGHAKTMLNGGGLLPADAVGGGMSTAFDTPLTSGNALGRGSVETSDMSEPETGGPNANAAGAAAAEQEESRQSAAPPFGQMRGAGRGAGAGAGAGAGEERGRRPDHLKSKTDVTQGEDKRVKEACAKHLKECGMAPIPFGESRLVCAKCGSILDLGGTETLSA